MAKANQLTAAPVAMLERLDGIRRDLADCTSVDVVKKLRDQSQQIADYAKAQGYHLDIQNMAAEAKLRCERRLGELLRDTVNHQGGRPKKHSHCASVLPNGVLPDQSSRWQRVASVPEKKFEGHISDTKKKKKELTTTGVLRIANEQQREAKRQKNRELCDVAPAIAPGRFPTIVMDPPWDWSDEGDVDQLGRATPTYDTMTIEQITALPVADIAETNAHLYLWITNRSLPKGFGLLDAWGFRYVTCLTWCKPSFGMGNYFRGSTEQILFGVRGSLSLLRADVGTWFAANRAGKHSSKPDEFYDLVESCSPGPFFEFFARKKRNPGWTLWGAEA